MRVRASPQVTRRLLATPFNLTVLHTPFSSKLQKKIRFSLTNDIKLDDPKLRKCAHFILFLVTLHCRPHSSGFLWYWPFACVPT